MTALLVGIGIGTCWITAALAVGLGIGRLAHIDKARRQMYADADRAAAQVTRDDDLIEALRDGNQLDDDELASMLTAWRDESQR